MPSDNSAQDGRHITVVLPSFNDRDIILPYFDAITAVLDGQNVYTYDLIYVDDGSSDGSQETLRELASNNASVTYIELMRNYGQQRAMFAGLAYSTGDVVITLDGDYQYEPQVILQLADAMGESYDVASGIRTSRKDSAIDVFASRLGNKLIGYILKIDIQDFGSVKAFSRKLVDRVLSMRHYYSDVHPSAFSLHPSCIEIEVDHRERMLGSSHWNIWMRLRLYVDLYVAYRDDQFQTPFKFGTLITCFGAAGGAALMLYKAILSHGMTFVEIAFATFIVMFTGFTVMAWSLTMSFLAKIYKQNVSDEPYLIRAIHSSDASEPRPATEFPSGGQRSS